MIGIYLILIALFAIQIFTIFSKKKRISDSQMIIVSKLMKLYMEENPNATDRDVAREIYRIYVALGYSDLFEYVDSGIPKFLRK